MSFTALNLEESEVTLGDELAVKRADALLAQHIRERAVRWVFEFGRGLDSERQRVEGRRS